MAGQAEKRGLPPELPLMASLVESGMKNLNFGDADSVGFFQMRVGIWNQGEYAGYPDKPELQIKWFLDNAEEVKKARIAAGKPIDDPNQLRRVDRRRRAPRRAVPRPLPDQARRGPGPARRAARPPAPPPCPPRPAPWWMPAAVGSGRRRRELARRRGAAHRPDPARRARGRRRTRGPQVDKYLAAAKVAPGNPWCASFITWSLEQAGHKMPGGGWAGVATWVRNAEQGNNGLKFVSAEEARPGDIVAYDWGGQNDFGADGHIGFLDSTVKDGKFTALEGNNADKVNTVPRSSAARTSSSSASRATRPPAPRPPRRAAVRRGAAGRPAAASKPIDPAQFGGEGTGTGGAPSAEAWRC